MRIQLAGGSGGSLAQLMSARTGTPATTAKRAQPSGGAASLSSLLDGSGGGGASSGESPGGGVAGTVGGGAGGDGGGGGGGAAVGEGDLEGFTPALHCAPCDEPEDETVAVDAAVVEVDDLLLVN